MNQISKTQKWISFVLKCIVFFSATIGTVMSYLAGRFSFMGGNHVFMYFTIQSNIAIAIICAIGAYLLFKDRQISFNSEMDIEEIKAFCPRGEKEEELLRDSYKTLNLSARGYHRILRCARTIADMDHSDRINKVHLSEAIGYRSIDRGIWNV